VANDLTDRRRRTAEVCRLSWHATLLDGEVVSFCDLRLLEVDGHLLAQVEDVTTPTAHRGHGLAGQVVAHAVHAAWAAGAELVWLEADADDWPREWYARMGFVESGGGSFNATRLAAG
jgi:GNAT superfamily N-acetyltransferase